MATRLEIYFLQLAGKGSGGKPRFGRSLTLPGDIASSLLPEVKLIP